MRKITSLFLAAVMLLAMLPMCFMAASADGASAATVEKVGGVFYETVPLYDPETPFQTEGKAGWTHFKTAEGAGVAFAASGRNLSDGVGILIDVKWTGAAPGADTLLKFKFGNGNGNTYGYYYGKGDNISGYSPSSYETWLYVKSENWEGTLFLPKETLDTFANGTADPSHIALAANEGMNVTYDNVRVAFDCIPDVPTTLPEVNKTWDKVTPLFQCGTSFDVSGDAQMLDASVFAEGAMEAFRDAPYGILFTLDATALEEGKTFDFALVLQAEWNGVSTYLSTTPYGGANLQPSNNYTNAPEVKPDTNLESVNWHSDWYLSYDGGAWTKQTNERAWFEAESRYAGGRYAVVPNAGGKVVYVYVPMSEFWTSDGEQYLTTGERPSGKENITSYAKFCEIVEAQVGKTWELTGVRLDYNKTDGKNAEVTISNFCVVSCAHQWSDGTQIQAPTHTQVGWQSSQCTKCGQNSVSAVAKLPEHNFESDTYVKVDSDTHGIQCECGEISEIAPHTWSNEVVIVVPATHLGGGVLQRKCTAKGCTAVKNAELPPLVDHEWDDGVVTTEATVEAEGVKTFTCVCGATRTEAIPKLSAAPATEEAAEDEGGCGSVVGGGFAMMAILSAAAAVVSKKRRK